MPIFVGVRWWGGVKLQVFSFDRYTFRMKLYISNLTRLRAVSWREHGSCTDLMLLPVLQRLDYNNIKIINKKRLTNPQRLDKFIFSGFLKLPYMLSVSHWKFAHENEDTFKIRSVSQKYLIECQPYKFNLSYHTCILFRLFYWFRCCFSLTSETDYWHFCAIIS